MLFHNVPLIVVVSDDQQIDSETGYRKTCIFLFVFYLILRSKYIVGIDPMDDHISDVLLTSFDLIPDLIPGLIPDMTPSLIMNPSPNFIPSMLSDLVPDLISDTI
jgi:hypothetical protein